MTGLLQRFLLSLYAIVNASGVLDSRFGEWIFLRSYFAYKHWLEPTPVALKDYVEPGSWIIDVGANVGFYTHLFAAWVSQGGKVLSIEPEQQNFLQLQQFVQSQKLGAKVVAVQAVASEIDGKLKLLLNPDSHADHRIAVDGIATDSWRLDSLIAKHGWPRVSLIKIDVQGSEPRVLLGSLEILARFGPAVYMEVDDLALNQCGSSSAILIESMRARGYAMHTVEGRKISAPLSPEAASAAMKKLGYADFLFLPRSPPICDAATQHSAK